MEKIGILKSKKLILPKKTSKNNLNSHIWFKQNGKKYMFKYAIDDEYNGRSFLNEMIISQMCKYIGLPCQDARLARYAYSNVDGVKIKSFLNDGEREISMSEIANEKYDDMLAKSFGELFWEKHIYPYIPETPKDALTICNKRPQTSAGFEAVDGKFPTKISFVDIELDPQNKIRLLFDIYMQRNSPAVQEVFGEDIVKQICDKIVLINRINTEYNESQTLESLEFLAKEYAYFHHCTLAPNFSDELAKMLIFDFAVTQTDRHLGNISLIANGRTLRLAPLFDNGHCLLYRTNYIAREKFRHYHTIMSPDLLKAEIAGKMIARLDDFVNKYYNDFAKDLLKNAPELLELAPHYKDTKHKSTRHRFANKNSTDATAGAFSTFAPSESEISAILNANVEWLGANGVAYSPELWLKTYLYASKLIMRERVDKLKFMHKKVNENDIYNMYDM